jgi:ComF family protein
VVAEAIKALKFRSISSLAVPLADLMGQRLRNPAESIEVLVAVPMSTGRMRERGFNQAELLASRLSSLWDIPALGGLVKTKPTEPQVRLDAASRLRNVVDAYQWRGPDISGVRIGVVDDVATTGATLMGVARTLYGAGATEVIGLVIARER